MNLKQSNFSIGQANNQLGNDIYKQTNKVDGPSVITGEGTEGLKALLSVEELARNSTSKEELFFILANQILKLTKARQVFVFSENPKFKIDSISGLPSVDRSAPIVRGFESIILQLNRSNDIDNARLLELSDYDKLSEDLLNCYPYPNLLWVPLQLTSSIRLGGILLTSEQVWLDSDIALGKRLAGTFSHALAFLMVDSSKRSKLGRKKFGFKLPAFIISIAIIISMIFPVPMTALAPVEVQAQDPFVVAAPFNGVVAEVFVSPNDYIVVGQPIIRFELTELRNVLEVSKRQALVAEANLKKTNQLAFNDPRGRHEVSIAAAEHELKLAELKFAQEKYDRATVKANQSGIAIFSDKQELIGKPTDIGERMMLIADPARVELKIAMDVSDSIALKSGGRVKVFLDSDPLVAREANIEFADYQAKVGPNNTLAFRVVAKFIDEDENVPRLGTRGTAQMFGDNVPLGLYLFRRPISSFRQWAGL